MNNNNWDELDYQKIETATLVDDSLVVCFFNGDCRTLPINYLLPLGIKDVIPHSLKVNEFNICFESSQGNVYIPWDKIRILTDDEFAKDMAKKAEENSRLVGDRLKSLRKRKKIKSSELAERAGVTPQTITRIEKGHTDVSFATLRKILAAMGYSLKDLAKQESHVIETKINTNYNSFLQKLNAIGINSSLVSKIIPLDIREKLVTFQKELPELMQSEVAAYFGRIFNWNSEEVWNNNELLITDDAAKLAYFKTTTKGNITQIKAYSHYAYYLAKIVLNINVLEPKLDYPGDLEEFKKTFEDNYGGLMLENLVNYTWDLGISVIPLNDAGIFHGASWNINKKHVIVLKQRNDSHARWIFDLLHELYHVFVHLENENTSVIEIEELNPFGNNNTPEEMEANTFANKIIFGDKAEEVVLKTLEDAEFKIEHLKRSISRISKSEKINADFIANYLAFRLQANNQNIWGMANAFQVSNPSPFDITSRILKERVDIESLNPIDKNILTAAINN